MSQGSSKTFVFTLLTLNLASKRLFSAALLSRDTDLFIHSIGIENVPLPVHTCSNYSDPTHFQIPGLVLSFLTVKPFVSTRMYSSSGNWR